MQSRGVIYFNDTRHNFLYVIEPPISIEQVQRAVDDATVPGVETLVFHVGDWGVYQPGLFYNTKLGFEWCGPDGRLPIRDGDWWRAWMNLCSLRERGLDLFEILIDRTHENGLRLYGSLRMNHGCAPIDLEAAIAGEDEIIEGEAPYASGGFLPPRRVPLGMPASPRWCLRSKHANYAHPEVRRRCLAIIDELINGYELDGVELDFAVTPFYFKHDEVEVNTPLMTEHVREISRRVHCSGIQLSARIFPTEAVNLGAGLDVRTWIGEGLVDWFVPMFYGFSQLDAQVPCDWLVELGAEVYPMLEPDEADALRAAGAVAYDRGACGLYTWNLNAEQRKTLEELGDPNRLTESDKRYVMYAVEGDTALIARHLGYERPLPIRIPSADPSHRYELPFHFADQDARQVTLTVVVTNLVAQDDLRVTLNDTDLAPLLQNRRVNSYRDQTLRYDLETFRPNRGNNILTFTLVGRPPQLDGPIRVDRVELAVTNASKER